MTPVATARCLQVPIRPDVHVHHQLQYMREPQNRKACFLDAEIWILIDLVFLKKDILLQKFNILRTNQLKKKVWAEITESVNSRAVDVKQTVGGGEKEVERSLSES